MFLLLGDPTLKLATPDGDEYSLSEKKTQLLTSGSLKLNEPVIYSDSQYLKVGDKITLGANIVNASHNDSGAITATVFNGRKELGNYEIDNLKSG